MGAFKIANSWGKAWGNNGFCWMTYSSIKKNTSMLSEFSTIEAASYNSDSDIKLVVDMNSDILKDSSLTLKAYSKITQTEISTSFAPFSTYKNSHPWSTVYHGFNDTDDDADTHGTFAYDLDMLIPDINSDNFNDYLYELNVGDSGNYEGITSLNEAYIYDYNRNTKIATFDCTKEKLSRKSLCISATYMSNDSYDFTISNLKYTNQTNIEKSCGSSDSIMVGDTVSLSSTIKNIGGVQAPTDKKLKLLYTVTDENGNPVDVPNAWSNNYINNPVLKPLKSVELSSNSGGNNGNGTISFSKPGTYKITAWVNDTNDYASEYGGYQADNNKVTFKVVVK